MSMLSRSRLLAAAMTAVTLLARSAAAQSPAVAPLDSVLRVLAADSARIVAFHRPPAVVQGADRVAEAMRELRVAPDSLDLVKRFVDAVTATTRDFTAAESSLGSQVLPRSAAQQALARSPHAAVVSIDGELPPRNTAVWAKVRLSNYGRQHMPRITFRDVANFRLAVSDSGFQIYRSALLGAFAKRMAELRQARDTQMAEIPHPQQKAAELPSPVGAADTSAGSNAGSKAGSNAGRNAGSSPEAHAVNVGLPVIAVVFVALLLAPRVYRSPELQQWIFTSGIWLEITTLVLVVIALLVLALAGMISQTVVGTVLGGVLGYVVGRSASRRLEATTPVSVPTPPRASDPVAATGVARPPSAHS